MLNEFRAYIEKKLHLDREHKVLLAISGGADSVAMLDLFAKANFDCGIAHCNFHLRGKASDGDEELVKQLSKKYNFPFHKVDFDTKEYAQEKGISIEMAARELRYHWFDKIRQDFDYKYIAVAHHQDDIIETFFINLTRGTGIKGLTGIKERNGNIVRPMLFTNRDAILEYIKQNSLTYREDESNFDVEIIRNKFRHKILPLLKEVNTAAYENILHTVSNLGGTESILLQKIEDVTKDLGMGDSFPKKIDIEKLSKLSPLKDYLFEVLQPYGFNAAQIEDIITSLNSESGKIFYSANYQLIKDRNHLVLDKQLKEKSIFLEVVSNQKVLDLGNGKTLKIEKIKRGSSFKIPTDPGIAAIDADQLEFPLKLRGWGQGDFFYPLGMNKKKKLSDFFIDEKLSLIEKKEILLLVSREDIVWVLGKRIDNRFKITSKTTNILQLELV